MPETTTNFFKHISNADVCYLFFTRNISEHIKVAKGYPTGGNSGNKANKSCHTAVKQADLISYISKLTNLILQSLLLKHYVTLC